MAENVPYLHMDMMGVMKHHQHHQRVLLTNTLYLPRLQNENIIQTIDDVGNSVAWGAWRRSCVYILIYSRIIIILWIFTTATNTIKNTRHFGVEGKLGIS